MADLDEKKLTTDPLEGLSDQNLLTYLSEEERHEHYPYSPFSSSVEAIPEQ